MDNKDIIFETDGVNLIKRLSGELIGQQKRWQGNWKREILI